MNTYSVAFKVVRGPRVLFSLAFVALLAVFSIYTLERFLDVPSLAWSPRPPAKVSTIHIPSVFPMPALEPVLMTVENSKHYPLSFSGLGNTAVESDGWRRLLPHGNGTVYLDTPNGHKGAFTISLFHQLRCLNIIREGLVSFRSPRTRSEPNRLVHHCMDYLRQMVLCRSNTQLQSVRNHTGTRITVSDVTSRCKDWTAVYSEVEKNYARYG